ncbi:hypothetical protein LTR95_006835 [Oleoguttula sp. CCFEE 5521]
MSAASQVFGLYELLENILHHSEMRDVLLHQRISKTFKSIIDGSSSLQEKLFFKPTRFTDAKGHEVEPVPNVLLLDTFLARHSIISNASASNDGMEELSAPVKRHQIIVFQEIWRKCRVSQRKPKGSWARMLLLQPPIHENIQYLGQGREKYHDWHMQELWRLVVQTKRKSWVCRQTEDYLDAVREMMELWTITM